MRAALVLAPLVLLASACMGPATGLARAQEAVQELNSATRYGRNEIALERVAKTARDDFTTHRRGWGTAVQIADLEVASVRARGEREAEAAVRVSWYRVEEQELRTTLVKQVWRDQGEWRLVGEERLEGDVGLLGERVLMESPAESRPRAYFPTVRLGSGSAD